MERGGAGLKDGVFISILYDFVLLHSHSTLHMTGKTLSSRRAGWDNSILLSFYFEKNSFICFLLLCHDFLLFFFFFFIFPLPKGPRMFLSVYNFRILVAFYFYIFYYSLWHIKKTKHLLYVILYMPF